MGTHPSQAPLISQSQDQFFDFYRANLKATADTTRLSLENSVRLRTSQLRCIDEALAENARLGAQIEGAKGLDELVAVSGKLAGAQYQTLISYWAAIYEAIGENQVEVARLVQAQAAQIQNGLGNKVGAAPGGPVPVLAVLQPLMEVASSAYALTARATAEATKLAAAQLTGANPASQPAEQAQQRSA